MRQQHACYKTQHFFSLPMQVTRDQKCINFDEQSGDSKTKYKYRYKMKRKW